MVDSHILAGVLLEFAEPDLLLTLLRQLRWVQAVGVHVVTLLHIVNRLRD
jgi:hypothetical protein